MKKSQEFQVSLIQNGPLLRKSRKYWKKSKKYKLQNQYIFQQIHFFKLKEFNLLQERQCRVLQNAHFC